ncbi:YccF domain-containing protein [Cutibacterium sp.]|uniref:YccF domain-containing protein n=1 Tax=Cutibacterium sp. TaxID=1912221 RepID=UPI0026DC645D|nr:YccF domain-containing protein [Cutibacterium sp.]MDO4413298.1 YccF domain-containing protein [Cutibacterium sp.]
MRFLLNVIWVLFAGFGLFLEYLLAGGVAFIFIITIPAAIPCWRIAGFVLWPFGRAVVAKPNAGAGSTVMNVVWFFVAGLWLAIGHVVTAFIQAITIIGIPLAIANLKLIPITCFPFGKMVVSNREIAHYSSVYSRGL